MRVLVISNLYPPSFLGGYELACSEAVDALRGRGHEVRVLTSSSHLPGTPALAHVDRCLDLRLFDPYPVSSETHGYNLFDAACSNLQNSHEVAAALKDFQPEVAYCWNLHGIGGLAILDLLSTAGVPWVLHLMDDLPGLLINHTKAVARPVFARTNLSLLRNALVISMSRNLLDEIARTTGIVFVNEPVIIPGWVTAGNISPRSRYRVDGHTRFIVAGALEPHKGLDLIFEAAARLLQEGLDDFSIDLYGGGSIERYQHACLRQGLSRHVRLWGPVRKSVLRERLADYDSFLFPTWEREPFGIAPLEAAAAGCVPVITSGCGVAERLTGNVHCLKIERTTDALFGAMSSIVLGKVDLPRIGRAASRLVREELVLDRFLGQIEGVLRNAKNGAGPPRVDDPKLPLLIHTKHHLARYLTLQISGS